MTKNVDWGLNDKPAEAVDWGLNDRDAAQQDLPAGVTPSTASAGRGRAADPRRLDRPAGVTAGMPFGAVNLLGDVPKRRDSVLEDVDLDSAVPEVTPEQEAINAARSRRAGAALTPTNPLDAPITTARPGDHQKPNRAAQLGLLASDNPIPGSRALAKAAAAGGEGAWGAVRAGAELVGADGVARIAKGAGESAQDFERGMGKPRPLADFNPRGPMPYLQDMFEGAATSLGQSAAYAVAFGPRAVIPLLSIQSAGTQYQAVRQAGLEPGAALANAIPTGAFEAIGEKFQGLDKAAAALRVLLTKGAPREAIQDAGEVLLRAGVREVPGEVITYLGQTGVDLLPGIGIRQDLTVEQFVDGLRDTVIQSAMMGTAMGTGGAIAAARGKQGAREKTAEDIAREKGFLVREAQVKRLTTAGEKEVAGTMQRQLDSERAQTELQALAGQPWAQGQDFQQRYRALRTEGKKPAEAAARAAMASAYQELGAGLGLSETAFRKAVDVAATLPLEKVPAFFERLTTNLSNQGLAATTQEGTIEGALSGVRNAAVSTALADVYGEEPPTDTVQAIADLEGRQEPAQPAGGAGAPAPAATQAVDNIGRILGVEAPANAAVTPPHVTANTGAAATAPATPRETVEFGAEDLSPNDHGAHQGASSPLNDKTATKAQILADNAPLGHMTLGKATPGGPALGVSIENAAGSERVDLKNDPPKWRTPMVHGFHYGRFKGTVGGDGEHVDGFFKEGLPENFDGDVFVVDQVNRDGSWDEAKVMVGPESEDQARADYLKHYEPGWQGAGAVTRMPMADFKKWVVSDAAKAPLGQIPAAPAPADQAAKAGSQGIGADPGAATPGADAGQGPPAVAPLRLGSTPSNAEPVTVRGGILFVGKYEALDFESGEPIRLPDDASDAQIRGALRAGGVLTKNAKLFGGEKASRQNNGTQDSSAVVAPADGEGTGGTPSEARAPSETPGEPIAAAPPQGAGSAAPAATAAPAKAAEKPEAPPARGPVAAPAPDPEVIQAGVIALRKRVANLKKLRACVAGVA